MPRRRQVTARQERLGIELRKLRETAGLKAREAATLVGSDSAQMSQMESGTAGVSEERVRSLAAYYSCEDRELIDALVAMATDRTPGWWEEYRGLLPTSFLDLSELEHHATYRWDVDFLHVPGLLQTEDYARALLRIGFPQGTEEEIQRRVALRMERQELLSRPDGPHLWAVMDETVLRLHIGGPKVMRAQIDRLVEATQMPNVTLQVVPFAAGPHPGMGGPFQLFRFQIPELPDIVYAEGLTGAGYLDQRTDVVAYLEALDRMGTQATPARRTENFLREIRKEL